MKFLHSGDEIDVTIDQLVVAGWTGRNQEAVDHHIEELRLLGIAPPSQVPLYYRGSKSLLVQDTVIDVLGEGTSGEVEPLLVQTNGVLYIGLASDHTDRDLEAHSVAASKQICLKPAARDVWLYETIEDHVDDLVLTCSIEENGEWVLYQEGTLASIRPLADLISGSGFEDHYAMLCGTLPAIGSVRPAMNYRMQLQDPVLKRAISLDYAVRTLEIVS